MTIIKLVLFCTVLSVLLADPKVSFFLSIPRSGTNAVLSELNNCFCTLNEPFYLLDEYKHVKNISEFIHQVKADFKDCDHVIVKTMLEQRPDLLNEILHLNLFDFVLIRTNLWEATCSLASALKTGEWWDKVTEEESVNVYPIQLNKRAYNTNMLFNIAFQHNIKIFVYEDLLKNHVSFNGCKLNISASSQKKQDTLNHKFCNLKTHVQAKKPAWEISKKE